MALIKCTVCGHVVSDKASKCQFCGTPIATIFTMMRNGQQQTPPNINNGLYQQDFPQQGQFPQQRQSYPQQGQSYPQQSQSSPQQGQSFSQQGQGYPQHGQGFPQQGQGYPQHGQQLSQPEPAFPDGSNAKSVNDERGISQPQVGGQPSDPQSTVNSPQSFKQPEDPFGVRQESQHQSQQNEGNPFWDTPNQGFDIPEGGFSDAGSGFDSMDSSDFGQKTEGQTQPVDTSWQDDFHNDNDSSAYSPTENDTYDEEDKIVVLDKKSKREKTGKSEAKRKKKNNIIILLIGVVVLAALLYFYFTQDDSDNKVSKKNRKQKTEAGVNAKGANPDPVQEKKDRDKMINIIDAVIGTESQTAQPKNTQGMAPKNNRKSNMKTLPAANPYLPKTKESTITTSGAYAKSKQLEGEKQPVKQQEQHQEPTKQQEQHQQPTKQQEQHQQPTKQQEQHQQSVVQSSTQSRSIQNAKDNNDFFNGY